MLKAVREKYQITNRFSVSPLPSPIITVSADAVNQIKLNWKGVTADLLREATPG